MGGCAQRRIECAAAPSRRYRPFSCRSLFLIDACVSHLTATGLRCYLICTLSSASCCRAGAGWGRTVRTDRWPASLPTRALLATPHQPFGRCNIVQEKAAERFCGGTLLKGTCSSVQPRRVFLTHCRKGKRLHCHRLVQDSSKDFSESAGAQHGRGQPGPGVGLRVCKVHQPGLPGAVKVRRCRIPTDRTTEHVHWNASSCRASTFARRCRPEGAKGSSSPCFPRRLSQRRAGTTRRSRCSSRRAS